MSDLVGADVGEDTVIVVDETMEVERAANGLTSEGDKRLASYLKSECDDILDGAERVALKERWKTWRRMAILEPKSKVQSWPWEGAANVVTPIAAQKVNTIYAKLVAMYAQVRPVWSTTAPRADMAASCRALSAYLNALSESPMALDLARRNRTIMYDLVRLGTQPVRVPWLSESVPIKKQSLNGSAENAERVVHDGPAVIPIRLEDFIARAEYAEVEQMPVVGHRVFLSSAEMRLRGARGTYANVEAVLGSAESAMEPSREDEQSRLGTSATRHPDEEANRVYEVCELFVRFDDDADGIAEDWKVWFHRGTSTILRAELNLLGRRDIVVLRYFPVPNELYGIGVCQYLEWLQAEADFLHNTRWNDLELILTPAFKRRQGSMALKKSKVRPGGFLDMADLNDVAPLVVPDFTGSTYAAENLVRDYADRISGANDPMSGYGDSTLKSGSNAASLMFLAQQGNSILNAVYDGIKRDYDEIGQLVVLQAIINFNANPVAFDLSALEDDDAAELRTLFQSSDVASLPTSFRFTVKSADISRSDDTKQQNVTLATQIYQQYGSAMVPMTQALASGQLDPLTSMLVVKLVRGATVLAKQSLSLLHIDEVDKMFIEEEGGASDGRDDTGGGAGGAGGSGMGAVGAGSMAAGPRNSAGAH